MFGSPAAPSMPARPVCSSVPQPLDAVAEMREGLYHRREDHADIFLDADIQTWCELSQALADFSKFEEGSMNNKTNSNGPNDRNLGLAEIEIEEAAMTTDEERKYYSSRLSRSSSATTY